MIGLLTMTEYQLLNVIRFVYCDCESARHNADLFICNSIDNAQGKAESLRNTGLFSNIYIIKAVTFSRNSVVRKIKTFLLTFKSDAFLQLIHPAQVETMKRKKYNVLVVPSATLQCEMFYNFFPHQELFYIEDGLGNYFGNIQNATMTKQHEFILRLLGRKETVRKMYVNRKDLCESNVTDEISQIPGNADERYLNLLRDIFISQAHHSVYRADDIIYLRQPMEDFGEMYVQIDEAIVNALFEVAGNRFIVRKHPRSRNLVDCGPYRQDCLSTAWEYECIDSISGKNCLIGMFSTAQITPKILFDLEPVVIFLFRLFPFSKAKIAEEMKMFYRFRELYRFPEKVIAPESREELFAILKEFM